MRRTAEYGGAVLDQEDLRARMRAEAEKRGWSQAECARRVGGLSATTYNQWLNHKYPGDVAAIDGKVARLLASLEAGDRLIAQRLLSPGWLKTPTAETIWAMLTQAQHAPDIVVVASAPGVGKTVTARAYRDAGANVWLASMDPDLATPAKMMAEIAITMSVSTKNAATIRRDIGERLDGSGGLLVIDEAQYLSRASLDMLRTLHDRYGIGVALLGNHGFYAGTAVGARSDNFAQFFSRVGARRRLEAPAARDVEMFLDAWGVEGAEVRQFLTVVAGKPGALRAVDKTLKAASAMAAGAGEALGVAHLRGAWAAIG